MHGVRQRRALPQSSPTVADLKKKKKNARRPMHFFCFLWFVFVWSSMNWSRSGGSSNWAETDSRYISYAFDLI